MITPAFITTSFLNLTTHSWFHSHFKIYTTLQVMHKIIKLASTFSSLPPCHTHFLSSCTIKIQKYFAVWFQSLYLSCLHNLQNITATVKTLLTGTAPALNAPQASSQLPSSCLSQSSLIQSSPQSSLIRSNLPSV